MKLNLALIWTMVILTSAASVSAQEIGVDQIKLMIAKSAENLTTYTYTRNADCDILYSNDSLQEVFAASKVTEGRVNLMEQSGWWGSELIDKSNNEALIWDGFFVNGSEYWLEGENWTQLIINDSAQVMEDYNELPSQVNLISYSTMELAGIEMIDGEECYKLVGMPIEPVFKGIIGLQIVAAYFASPFALPEEVRSGSLNIDEASLLDGSTLSMTAWVSKQTHLLKRMDINSDLKITPQILNISSQDYLIESTLSESTVYSDFGEPVEIELPSEALINPSFRFEGTDWRWAVFGAARP